MTLKFTVHGIEVIATDAAEAAKLIRELAKPEASDAQRVNGEEHAPDRQRKKLNLRFRKGTFNVTRATVAFLDAVNEAGEGGTHVEGIMPALAADKPKGTGARLAKVNAYLRALGFNPDDVYSNQRTRNGRVWIALSKMNSALEAARKAER